MPWEYSVRFSEPLCSSHQIKTRDARLFYFSSAEIGKPRYVLICVNASLWPGGIDKQKLWFGDVLVVGRIWKMREMWLSQHSIHSTRNHSTRNHCNGENLSLFCNIYPEFFFRKVTIWFMTRIYMASFSVIIMRVWFLAWDLSRK